jgi:hypothetical protein
MRSAKGTVRSFILDALKAGTGVDLIFSDLCHQKGLKPGNAKLHIKKAKAQFEASIEVAVVEKRKRNRSPKPSYIDTYVKQDKLVEEQVAV